MFLTIQQRVAVGVGSPDGSEEGPTTDTEGLVSMILAFTILISAILVTTAGSSSRAEGPLTVISVTGGPRNS